MSYCPNTWISTYNYAGLAKRSELVNKSLSVHTDQEWTKLLLSNSGASFLAHKTHDAPVGPTESALVKDAAGNTIKQIRVARHSLSDLEGAFISLPTPEADWASIVLQDREIVLREVRPVGKGLVPVSANSR
jgi:hypothetical protein